ncbi:MAG TPA: chemotaxis protein CheB [Gemmatimonadales bacterium]|nr:chemotaxis protein CheB [Gemmatimonadales bacterium]
MARKRGAKATSPAKRPALSARRRAKSGAPDQVIEPPPGNTGDSAGTRFPVVGVGASAGGLHALQRFFDAIPAAPGIAFVVVQHLDPTHKSETAELLRRHSRLPVVQLTDNERVEVDRVYVIPPNSELAIVRGVLHLARPANRRGMRMPIDAFLRSLADDQQERSVAVILSGTGADGTLGIKAVKAAGGLTMAQDPETAEYDGMPRNAVATGMVDFELPVEKLPGILLQYVSHPYLRQGGSPSLVEQGPAHLQAILALLRARTKYDFSCYKKGTISRRIERRMSLKHLERIQDYVKYLQDHPPEIDDLFKDLLISVTSFFREPQAWEYLEQHVLPRLIEERAAEGMLRLWVPGCATGEEAYSLAMLLLEAVQNGDQSRGMQVFASDLDSSALDFARAGLYPESIAADVSRERLHRFFVREDQGYRVNKGVRDLVVFSVQNLISDPPFSRIDLITCRNLMIYLAPEIQQRVISLFHFALRPGGYLLLGNAESVGSSTDQFEVVAKKWRIYRRIGPATHDRIEFPVVPGPWHHPVTRPTAPFPLGRESKLLGTVQSLVLERYVPACALVNAKGEILYLFGPTDRYLLQPTGQLTRDLLAWSRGGIRSKLRASLRQAIQQKQRASATGAVLSADGETRPVRITVDPLVVPKELEGCFLVVFEQEYPHPGLAGAAALEPGDDSAVRQMEYEVGVLREQLRTGAEQFEASNEELKSANEEMMSMNEELQSTNEELETSKEELQSLNEELSTVNSQLENKVQELEATNDDLNNLLSSTNIATIFLDRQFRIRRFTPPMTQLLSLRPTDLRRPIGDFAQKFTDRRLIPDAERVLATLGPIEAEVQTDDGRWYLRRILPYRTEGDRIDGVVVTFTDITERRKAEEERVRLAAIVESSGVAIIGMGLDGVITSWNRGAERLYGHSPKEAIGHAIDILTRTGAESALQDALRQVARGDIVERVEAEQVRKDGEALSVLLTASPIHRPETGALIGASAIVRDMSAQRKAESGMQEANERLEARVADRTAEMGEANRRLAQEVEERRRSEASRKTLLQRLVTIENEERRRISRELHDQIGQHLAALTLRLKALETDVTDQTTLNAAQAMVDDLGRQVRDLALAVRPTALDELGLLPALSNYAEDWAQRHAVHLDYHDRGLHDHRLAPAIEEAIYRIVLEALANVSKHAHARRASLILERRGRDVRVIVEDDGVGFDPEALKMSGAGQRLGLIGIEERAALVNGTATVESRPGGGTTLFVHIPVADGQP